MEIERIVEPSGHTFYKDADRRYSRIIGSVSWPGSRPGFICIVGESYYPKDPLSEVRDLWLLAEAEEMDPMRLFAKCVDIRERYQVERILADCENETILDLLRIFNRDLVGGRSLSLYDASFPYDLSYHLSMVKTYVQPQAKVLHFNEKSLLRDYLLEINTEDVQGKVNDHSAVMSLGFVLSYVKTHPVRDPQAEKLQRILEDRETYDPLNW